MKAEIEVVRINSNDIVVTSHSEPCGIGYTPSFGGGCEDPDME